jgi:hypothetical protein
MGNRLAKVLSQKKRLTVDVQTFSGSHGNEFSVTGRGAGPYFVFPSGSVLKSVHFMVTKAHTLAGVTASFWRASHVDQANDVALFAGTNVVSTHGWITGTLQTANLTPTASYLRIGRESGQYCYFSCSQDSNVPAMIQMKAWIDYDVE